ncbi:hypothetical protein H5410_028309 [Solanum commersonii]|uniref:Disease resistance protein Roq1-like winged-helix domain-containing protein n=1 Tax=Solanum commersonii TaxID=4109 RepID=A0A9J5Z1Q4_SOLCO|nr:hypothetical protein H5410_028309 [Solanum commersonii]
MPILESYDVGAEYGLDFLIDKSLIFISNDDKIKMYDLIQDMGRYVVKMQKKKSGEPSRVWDIEDFEDVMVNDMFLIFITYGEHTNNAKIITSIFQSKIKFEELINGRGRIHEAHPISCELVFHLFPVSRGGARTSHYQRTLFQKQEL